MPEVVLLLDPGKDDKPFMSDEQMAGEAGRWAGLSALERWQEYRDAFPRP
jgi:hypothetical protein